MTNAAESFPQGSGQSKTETKESPLFDQAPVRKAKGAAAKRSAVVNKETRKETSPGKTAASSAQSPEAKIPPIAAMMAEVESEPITKRPAITGHAVKKDAADPEKSEAAFAVPLAEMIASLDEVSAVKHEESAAQKKTSADLSFESNAASVVQETIPPPQIEEAAAVRTASPDIDTSINKPPVLALIFVTALAVILFQTLPETKTPAAAGSVAAPAAQAPEQEAQQLKTAETALAAAVNEEDSDALKKGVEVVSRALARSTVPVQQRAPLAEMVSRKSREYKIDPLLVSAVIMAESSFNSSAKSAAGKIGLLQLHPQSIPAGRSAAGKSINLEDPEINLDLGLWRLRRSMRHFHGDTAKSLLAFSWGRENLEKLLAEGGALPPLQARYLQNVERYYNAWKGSETKELSLGVIIPKPAAAVVSKAAPKAAARVTWERQIASLHKPEAAKQLTALIKEKSSWYQFEPELITALIMAESSFNPAAIAADGKRGLLQISPKWGYLQAVMMEKEWKGPEALLEAEYNLDLGLAYLQHLRRLFTGDLEKAILAHNLTPIMLAKVLGGEADLPRYTLRYLENIRSFCDQWGCRLIPSTALTRRLMRPASERGEARIY